MKTYSIRCGTNARSYIPRKENFLVLLVKADSLKQALNKTVKKHKKFSIEDITTFPFSTIPVRRFRRREFHRTERRKFRYTLKLKTNKECYEEIFYSEYILRRCKADLNCNKKRINNSMRYF